MKSVEIEACKRDTAIERIKRLIVNECYNGNISNSLQNKSLEEELEYDFANVKGQLFAKKGVEIAAAGAHNIMMIGSPGSGKTLIARCISGILPPLNKEESLQTSEIYSIANLLKGHSGLIKQRPFRAPHHTITTAALVGGGNKGLPGEISLAHNGVLFLDEFAEFERKSIEVLRQPLENGTIEISRVNNKLEYPASFMFVAAMNPCPCGKLYDSPNECSCTSSQIAKYNNKISAPILDRIDICLKFKKVEITDLLDSSKGESSSDIAKRVLRAREVQYRRYKGEKFFTNSAIPQSKIAHYCQLGENEKKFLAKAVIQLKLSARGYSRILKISRTIADLKEKETIGFDDLSLALQLRFP